MSGERETLGTAVYNADDDTLRWSPGARLDPGEYARTRAAGFKWWRGSEAWVAKWTPEREDFLLEVVEEIEHEADPDDPESRITRFAGRAAAASKRYEVRREAALSRLPPMGEPIKLGHHSRFRHRRDIEIAEAHTRKGMEEAAKAEHWRRRAAGAERRARQKSDPSVIQRRIEKLEADYRRVQRALAGLEQNPPTSETAAAWELSAAHWQRWVEHLDLRLEFERARLASLDPEPFAPVTAYKKGDVVDTKHYGRCEVVRVGPKNVKVRQLTGPTKGWEWAVPPHELRPAPPEEPSTSG